MAAMKRPTRGPKSQHSAGRARHAAAASDGAPVGRGAAANETVGRALWTGTVGFGLIQIPVKLFTAESSKELAFHELDRRDSARIGYERVNKSTGEPVEWKDVVKGYEIERGRFVILEREDFEKASVEASQSIDVVDFVPAAEIAWPYFEKPYYIVPDKRGLRAYAVLRDALASKGYAGVGLVVLRTRQHLCAVIPQGQGLVLEILRFEHDLKPMAGIDSAPASSARDVALAEKLMDAMVGRWNPGKYRDSYSEDLLAAIREKDKTGKIAPAKHAAARPSNVTDLSELLRQSMASLKKGGGRSVKKGKAAGSGKAAA
jgi:DNA end-binding protein Ku